MTDDLAGRPGPAPRRASTTARRTTPAAVGWSTADDDVTGSSSRCREPDRLVAPDRTAGAPLETHPTGRNHHASPSGGTILDFGQNISGRLRIRLRGAGRPRRHLRHAEVLEHGELARPLRTPRPRTPTSSRRRTESWEPRVHVPRLSLRGDRRLARRAGPRCGRGGRRAHRPGADRLVRMLARRAQPAARERPSGACAATSSTCPRTARSATSGSAGPATSRCSRPTASFLYDCRGFLAPGSPTSPQSRPTAPSAPTSPGSTCAFPVLAGGGLGRCRRHRAVDAVRALRRRRRAPAAVRQHARVGRLRRRAGRRRRCGTRLPVRRLARSRRTTRRTRPPLGRTPALVATAYFARTARAARPRRRRARARRGRARYERACGPGRRRVPAEFVTPTGRLASDAQTAYALALRVRSRWGRSAAQRAAADSPSSSRRTASASAPASSARPLVCDALVAPDTSTTPTGCCCRRECPSWLYPVTMGATTVWERWDSMLPDGSVNPGEMTSFNHYALGAVADWLHRVVGRARPGRARLPHVPVRRRPGGGLTDAHATLAPRTATRASVGIDLRTAWSSMSPCRPGPRPGSNSPAATPSKHRGQAPLRVPTSPRRARSKPTTSPRAAPSRRGVMTTAS